MKKHSNKFLYTLLILTILSTLFLPLTSRTNSNSFDSNSAISAGDNHTLILNSNGRVYSVGWNWYGQLGNGGALSQHTPIRVESLDNVIDIAAGGFHSLALRYDGTVWAWGNNQNGQLGLGDNINHNVPVQIPNLENIISIAAGSTHNFALDINGNVFAWGNNSSGQLGLNDTYERLIPTKIEGLKNIVTITAGDAAGFAIDKDQNLYGWGRNETGQITSDVLDNQLSPIHIENNATSVAAGNEHTIANLLNNERMMVWGVNWGGQLGFNRLTATSSRLTYTEHHIAAGEGHSLVIWQNDGNNDDIEEGSKILHVYAFGWNESGQLGLGHEEDVFTPTRIKNLENITFVAAGPESSFAIDSNGYIWAWGANTFGQLGLSNTESTSTPIRMNGVNGRGYLRVR